MIISQRNFQIFKYSIYIFLTANFPLFFAEEWAAASIRFVDGISLNQIIEGFAASIDTIAWLILLYVFELETYILDDHQFTKKVTLSLRLLRIISYLFIIYAFYGYLVVLFYTLDVSPLENITNLCNLTNGQWTYSIDFQEYQIINSENCLALSSSNTFLQFSGINAVVDNSGYIDIVRLAWIDVINSSVWLLVVLVLEVDVYMQENKINIALINEISKISKYILYAILFFNAAFWSISGDFVDWWDAWLWLIAFIFIELNIIQWKDEDIEKNATA